MRGDVMEANQVNEVEVVKSLPCKLTEVEKSARWETFGKLTREQATMKASAKSAAKEAKAAIERVEEQAWQVLTVAQSGVEYRDIRCIERVDIAKRLRETVRLDTREVVYTVPVTADELHAVRQSPLPGMTAEASADKPKRAKKGAKDGAATSATGEAAADATSTPQPSAAPDAPARPPEPSYITLPRTALEALDRDSRQRLDAELVECGTGANAGVLVWQLGMERAVAGPIDRHAISTSLRELAEEFRLALGIVPAADVDAERAEAAGEPPADDAPPNDPTEPDAVDNGPRIHVPWIQWNKLKPTARRTQLGKIEAAGFVATFGGDDEGLTVSGIGEESNPRIEPLLEAMRSAGLDPQLLAIADAADDSHDAVDDMPPDDDAPPPDDIDEADAQPIDDAIDASASAPADDVDELPAETAKPAPAVAAVPAPPSQFVRLVVPPAQWKRAGSMVQRALIGALNRLDLYPTDGVDGLKTTAVARNNTNLLKALDAARGLGITLVDEAAATADASLKLTAPAEPSDESAPAPAAKKRSRKKKGDATPEDGA
jgi:hypothetical protein